MLRKRRACVLFCSFNTRLHDEPGGVLRRHPGLENLHPSLHVTSSMWRLLPHKVPMQALLAAATQLFSSGVSSRAPRRLNTRFDMNSLLEQ
jgi:hypothetical protein